MTTITMTPDEMTLVRGLVGQEIDSVRVIELKNPNTETPYTRALSGLESKLAKA